VLDGWPLKFTDLERLLVNYVLILIGSGAHLAIDALKAAKVNNYRLKPVEFGSD